MQKISLKVRYSERGLSKCRKKAQSRKITLLVINYLTKFESAISNGFEVIPKCTSPNLCMPVRS